MAAIKKKDAAKKAVGKVPKAFSHAPPKAKAKCPSATSAKALLSDSHVKAGMKKAADESHIGGKSPIEQGGFILKDSHGKLSIARWPHGKADKIQPPISKDGKYQHKKIVGSFHTHPNVGPGWKQDPSNADINFVKNFPLTAGPHHFVISQQTIYHINCDGKVSKSGKTRDILK